MRTILGTCFILSLLTGCDAIPDSPYRPTSADVVVQVSPGRGGLLHYVFEDGQTETVDRNDVLFLSPEPDRGDLLLRGTTDGQAWAFGLPNRGDCWQLLGGGEVRDGRLATSQQLSLPFAPVFDPEANEGPRWVNDRGYEFCVNDAGEVWSVRRQR